MAGDNAGGISGLTLSDLAQTYICLISTAIIYAWIYNSTKGSLLLVMVAHAGHNIGTELIPAGDSQAVPVIVALLYLVVATVVVLTAGPRTLSRSVAVHRPRTRRV